MIIDVERKQLELHRRGRPFFRNHFPVGAWIVFLLLFQLTDRAFSQSIVVAETIGLRRFGYPVTVPIDFSAGSVPSLETVRLIDSQDQDVAAQFTAMSRWSDGSVRDCEIDYNISLGPYEKQAFRIGRGTDTRKALPKGLVVTESEESIVVGSSAIQHHIRRDGKPLLKSISFGTDEFLASAGVVTGKTPAAAKVLKHGPFNATIDLGDIRLEYVNSKSWVKLTQRSESSATLVVEAHFPLTSKPLMWDLGLGSWLYGTLPGSEDTIQLRKESSRWDILSTTQGKPSSLFASSTTFDGCGHFVDQQKVAAFGLADCHLLDEPQIQFRGDGRVRISAKARALTVYFHVVRQPAQVTAVTSPQSMVAPLQVTVHKIPQE